jgi:serine/threonine protein kinase
MVGKNIAHYRIESELGRGGIGVVYRALDVRLERTVALKVLADQWQQRPEYCAMILAEARAAVALNHPAVATVYEVGGIDPHFQSLQNYPSFRTLLAKLKREWAGYEKEFGGVLGTAWKCRGLCSYRCVCKLTATLDANVSPDFWYRIAANLCIRPARFPRGAA